MTEKRDIINIDQLETFLFFIGYPRSGHSLIGSLLDAHENAVIAHELGAFICFENGEPPAVVYDKIIKKSEEFTDAGRNWMGYNYAVPGQWQGRFESLKVIGDKSGGRTTRRFMDFKTGDPVGFVNQMMEQKVKMIHIIRNPFDNITTMCIRTNKRNGKPIDHKLLELKTKHYFKMVEMNQQIRQQYPDVVFDITLELFITEPEDKLKELCQFAGLTTREQYIKDCSSIVWEQTNKTRLKIEHLWTKEVKDKLMEMIQKYDFLDHYNYEE